MFLSVKIDMYYMLLLVIAPVQKKKNLNYFFNEIYIFRALKS